MTDRLRVLEGIIRGLEDKVSKKTARIGELMAQRATLEEQLADARRELADEGSRSST